MRPEIIAWRGAGRERVENTVGAILAVPRGIRLVEVDTRLTLDGRIVLFHSPSARCLTGHPGKIAAMTLRELQALTLRGGGEITDDARIPTAGDAATAASRMDLSLMLHVKREVDAERYALATTMLPWDGRILFHSNSVRHLVALRDAGVPATRIFQTMYRPVAKMHDAARNVMLGHRPGFDAPRAEAASVARYMGQGRRVYLFAGGSADWVAEARTVCEEALGLESGGTCGYLTDNFEAAGIGDEGRVRGADGEE